MFNSIRNKKDLMKLINYMKMKRSKKMTKKKMFGMILILSVILMISFVNVGAESVTLKLGNKEADIHHESLALNKFAELVEEKTNGEIKVNNYFNEALGVPNVQLENVIQGVQDIYVVGYYVLEKYIPDFKVTELLYFIKSREHFQNFLLSDIVAGFEEELLKKTGMRVINKARNWWLGPYRAMCSKNPVLTVEDLNGLRLRAPDSKTVIRIWQGLGCNVTVVPWSEVYLALSQGLVDAATGTIMDMSYEKFYEVAPHITPTNSKFQQACMLMNNAKFESFTKEQQQAIYEAADEAGEYCTKLLYDELDAKLADMKAKGAIFHEVDTLPWQEKAESVLLEMEAEGFITKGLMEKVEKLAP